MLKLFIAIPFLTICAGIFLLSKNKSAGYKDAMREYDFKISSLAPVGFYLSEKISFSPNQAYDRKIRTQLAELYGARYANIFYEVHTAQKYSLVVLVIFIFGLLGILGDVDISFFVLGLVVTGLVYYLADQSLKQKVELKKREILLDLPKFLSILVLLLGAGLPYPAASKKIISDGDPYRPLYKELNLLQAEVNAGKPINQAYEDFAFRCKIPEITRFVSSLLQNLNRGSADLVYVLRMLSQECWQRRKEIAKKQGEEATSKLVIPMVMVFIAVSIIVLAPAVITMSR